MATRKYLKEQPYIYRLTRLGQLAAERGARLAFLDSLSSTIWSGEVKGWHEGNHLARGAARAGMDLAEMDAVLASDHERLDAQRLGGHYGVPLMVFDGESFFGQDRFDQMKWRMEHKGVARRQTLSPGQRKEAAYALHHAWPVRPSQPPYAWRRGAGAGLG